MKSRIILVVLVILNLTTMTHALFADCPCDSAGYGSFRVSGPQAFTCTACPGNVGYRWDCDSTDQCAQSIYCAGGCKAGCYCSACTTACNQFSSCPCGG